MPSNWDKAKRYIWRKTTNVSHGTTTFFDHLWSVYDILKDDMKQDEYLCRAGLFHSIYGTAHFKNFKDDSLSREQVKKWIGEKAENLVYEFCKTKKRTKSIFLRTGDWSDDVYKDLVILEIANLRHIYSSRMEHGIKSKSFAKENQKRMNDYRTKLHYLYIVWCLLINNEMIDELNQSVG